MTLRLSKSLAFRRGEAGLAKAAGNFPFAGNPDLVLKRNSPAGSQGITVLTAHYFEAFF